MQQIRPLFCPCLWTFSVNNSHAYFPLKKFLNLSSLAFCTGSSIKSKTKSVYLKNKTKKQQQQKPGDYWSSVKSTHKQSWTWQWFFFFFFSNSLYHNCSKLLFGANKNLTNVNVITPPPPPPPPKKTYNKNNICFSTNLILQSSFFGRGHTESHFLNVSQGFQQQK